MFSRGAQMALDEIGVKIVGGASGKVADVVAAFLKGELEVNPDFQCHHHDHDGEHKCGEHGCHDGGAGHFCRDFRAKYPEDRGRFCGEAAP